MALLPRRCEENELLFEESCLFSLLLSEESSLLFVLGVLGRLIASSMAFLSMELALASLEIEDSASCLKRAFLSMPTRGLLGVPAGCVNVDGDDIILLRIVIFLFRVASPLSSFVTEEGCNS